MNSETRMAQVRVVRFPIKLKLIAIITFLLLISLSIYAIYALDHFKKDKSAYIFETALSTTEGISNLLTQDLKNTQQTLRLMGTTYDSNPKNASIVKNIFEANPNIVEFSIYSSQSKDLLFNLSDEFFLRSNNLENSYFRDIVLNHPIPFNSINESVTFIENPSDSSGVPHLLLAEYSPQQQQYFVARLKLDGLIDLMQSNATYESYVLNSTGKPLIHKDIENIIIAPSGDKKQFYDLLVKESSQKAVKEFTKPDSSEVLVSYLRNPDFGIMVVSEIPKEKALSAAAFLIKKSVYFAIFLVSLSIIIGIIFSRSLTAPVDVLFRGIQKITKGDFSTQVAVDSVDEIGALSDSFNFMSQEILRYMDEMKEKIRLEREVEVAHLVQNSFFPENELKLGPLDIAAYYTPASECGGDWWGHITTGNKTALFVADATGHGVPAALLTATANSSVSIIGQLIENNPELMNSPSKMMKVINQAVCNVGNQILMTFFIAVIDFEKNKISFSNASHNPPLKVVPKDGKFDKSSFKPLLGTNGPHLGKDPNANYNDEEAEFNKNDSLILFTDGIIECANKEGKQWGERRFLKSLLANIESSPASLRDSVVKEAYEFYGGVAPDDDITLIIVKPNSGKQKSINSKPSLNFSSFKIHSKSLCAHLPIGINNTPENQANIFIIDAKQLIESPKDLSSILENHRKNTIVISDMNNDENIITLLGKYQMSHVIGANGLQIQRELFKTCQKISERNVWGIENYVCPEDPLYLVEINDSLKINKAIEELLDRIDMGNFFSSPKNFLQTISNEMVTNALFNSTDNQKTDRSEDIHLGPNHSIIYKIGKYDNNLILSVTDNSGTLTKETILKSLVRSATEKTAEQKEGGAGLGIYMIYSFTNQLIYNIQPGKKTEVICIIEDTKRYKQFRNRITSFHYFEEQT